MTTLSDEDGLTLIEIAITLLILSVVLTAFIAVMSGGLRSLSDSRARQTSSQLSTEIIEDLRAVSPPEVAMDLTPAEADAITCAGTPRQFDPDGPGPVGCEDLVVNGQGEVTNAAPWFTTSGNIDVATYVTRATTTATGDSIPDGTVRVTVVLDYQVPGGNDIVRRSALFSEVARG